MSRSMQAMALIGVAAVAGVTGWILAADEVKPSGVVVPEKPPAAPVTRDHVRALDTLMGATVWGSRGEKLGKIENLAIDPNRDRIAYAVLSFGGFLGIGDKQFAVPWSALSKNLAPNDRDEISYSLNIERSKLEQASGFDKDRWPAMADVTWGRDVHAFYNQRPYWEERERSRVRVEVGPIRVDVGKDEREPELKGTPVSPKPGDATLLVKADDLVGHTIIDPNGVKLGELKAVMADPQSGQLVYGILKITNATGFNSDDRYPVPWAVLDTRPSIAVDNRGQVAGDREAFRIILNAPLDKVRKGPLFHEDNWPGMTRQWGAEVYKAYDVKPFWKD